ncbi:C6 finger domain-containing protein [Seiridium cupressi]
MAARSPPSVSVHIKLTVDPNKVDEFLGISRPMFDAVVAEPLNTFFEMYRDDKTPGVFKLVENWDADIDYMMNVQVKKDYYKPYHAALREMLLKPHEVELYSRMPGNEWVKLDLERYTNQDENGSTL